MNKLNIILTSENTKDAVVDNLDIVLELIPEIKSMINFPHNHPHHHLDVWNHTLEVVNNLDSTDLELNMAALLHDIGKPFSYQDEEVRHFRGHPKVSFEMTKNILNRLGYEESFIDRVSYLVRTHDEKIDPNNLDNEIDLVKKRLTLQYADAKSHHPDKVQKRINLLDGIKEELYSKVKSKKNI